MVLGLGYIWQQSQAVLRHEKFECFFLFKSASIPRAARALGDRFLYVVSHMWPETFASKRIVHFSLT